MGVWSSFKEALGLQPDPEVEVTEDARLGRGALARLDAMAADRGIAITLQAVTSGWMVRIDEVDAPDAAHPAFDDLPVVCDDDVLDKIRGLTIDHDDGRWRVSAKVSVRAKETPNPDGRMYTTNRALSSGRIYVTAETPAPPYLATTLLSRDDVASVLIRGATLTIERVPGMPWDAIDQAVAVAVRTHVLSAGGVLTPRARVEDDDELRSAVWEILEHRVLPALHRDGGDLELIDVSDGVVTVHLVGACRTCPASTLTLKHGIERTLLDAFPGEIDEVRAE